MLNQVGTTQSSLISKFLEVDDSEKNKYPNNTLAVFVMPPSIDELKQRLKKRSVLPDLMLSSPANRALTTCRIIANEIGYSSTGILTRNEIYHAGSQTLLSIVQSLKDKNQSVMIFGHNPGFTRLANELTSMNLYNIPTCGVFACEFASETWQTIQYGQGKLLFYDYPKNMAL